MLKNSFNFTSWLRLFFIYALRRLLSVRINVFSGLFISPKKILCVLSLYLESINFIILTTKTFKED